MATMYFAPSANFVSTTLNGAINDSVNTVTLNSTTSFSAPGYAVINRQDSLGNNTPSAREVIAYTGISGSDLTGVTRASDGSTARSHADGSLVEPILTVGMWNDLLALVGTSLATVGGTLLPVSTATITTAEITNAVITGTATIASLKLSSEPAGITGQFYWARSSSLTTVLAATAADTHFPLQRATKNLTINNFFASVISAPSLAPLEMDVSWASGPTGTFASIFSTRPFVDIGEYSTLSSATPGTLSLTSLASGIVLRSEIRKHGNSAGLAMQLQVSSR